MNKGFTLIELLAVIVILAIIALIAVPIIIDIIEDSKKAFYYRGLSEWNNGKGYLTDTCLDGQDTFKRLLDMFDISYE